MAEDGYDPTAAEYGNEETPEELIALLAEKIKRWNEAKNDYEEFAERLNLLYDTLQEQEDSKQLTQLQQVLQKQGVQVNSKLKSIIGRIKELDNIRLLVLRGSIVRQEYYKYFRRMTDLEKEREDMMNKLRSLIKQIDLAEREYDPNRPSEAAIAEVQDKIRAWFKATANQSLGPSRKFEGAYDGHNVIQFDALWDHYRTVVAMLDNVERSLIQIGNTMNAERANIHVRYKDADISPFINDMYDLYTSVDQSLEECQYQMNMIANQIQSAEQRNQSKQTKRYKRNQMKRYAKLLQRLNAIALRANNDSWTLSTIEANIAQLSEAAPQTQSEMLFPKQLRGDYLSGVRKRVANARQIRQARDLNKQQMDRFYAAAFNRTLDSDEHMEIEERAKLVVRSYNALSKRYREFAERHNVMNYNVQQQPDSKESRQMLQLLRDYEAKIKSNRQLIDQRRQELFDIFHLAYGFGRPRQDYYKHMNKLAAFEKECEEMSNAFSSTMEQIEQQYSQWIANV